MASPATTTAEQLQPGGAAASPSDKRLSFINEGEDESDVESVVTVEAFNVNANLDEEEVEEEEEGENGDEDEDENDDDDDEDDNNDWILSRLAIGVAAFDY